jgi:membrane associated rhomboid family serine protease
MFLPYKDENPTSRFAVVSFLLVIVNVCVFFYQVFGAPGFENILNEYGLIPIELAGGKNLPSSRLVSPYVSLFTYMFCHGNIPHLLFNMLFLWIFGNNVEDRMTPFRFLVFYLLVGAISAIAFVLKFPLVNTPLVGASGAISGILGAYLFMYPMSRIYVWVLFFVIRIRAFLFLPIWFALQIFGFMGAESGDGSNVAWISHISGFIAGVLLFKFFTRRF